MGCERGWNRLGCIRGTGLLFGGSSKVLVLSEPASLACMKASTNPRLLLRLTVFRLFWHRLLSVHSKYLNDASVALLVLIDFPRIEIRWLPGVVACKAAQDVWFQNAYWAKVYHKLSILYLSRRLTYITRASCLCLSSLWFVIKGVRSSYFGAKAVSKARVNRCIGSLPTTSWDFLNLLDWTWRRCLMHT